MGCRNSKGTGRGDEGPGRPQAVGSSGRTSSSFSRGPPDLSRNLAWIQEKNFEDKFEVVKTIGQGSIGEVFVVKRKWSSGSFHGPNKTGSSSTLEHLDSDANGDHTSASTGGGGRGGEMALDRLYAMKSIYVNRLSKSRVEEFENEVQILQQLHHPNIVQLREVFYHKKRIYMLMTLCTGGQLNHQDFTETQVCSAMSQVIRALVYMHETAKICHRDLKMENIMLESAEDPFVVKLIDFGLSKVFTEGDKMRTACGTVYTMAPEVLSGAGYTQKADLWSAGVIAFVLLSGTLPFLKDEADLNDAEKVDRLAHARFVFGDPKWKAVSSGAKGFVRGLLKKQPGFRWTAREALDYCAETWAPSLLRGSYADLSTQAALAATEAAERGGSDEKGALPPGGTPLSPPLSPSSPSRRGQKKTRGLPNSIATSMRRFADYGELKKAALMVTAFQLGKDEIKQLKVLQEHGVDQAEVDRVFGAVDMDSSGRLHYMEFLAATVEARGYIEEERLKEAFERLDVDSTGFISRENLTAVLGNTYDTALIDKMLKEGDSSLSGSIEWEDFLTMMRPVVEEEYRKEAEAMLADMSPAVREATEVERRAVDLTPSFVNAKQLLDEATVERNRSKGGGDNR